MQKQEYFVSLDALRGIAALLVVLYHLPGWYLPIHQAPFIRNGGLMVNFFFVLSGFVLFHSWADRIHSRFDFKKFIALRFGRIYPVHLVFLLLFLGAECIKYAAARHGASSGTGTPFRENSTGAFVECLLLVQALGFSDHHAAFNFPSWSISTEFYTYFIFAFIAGLFPKRWFASVAATLFCGSLALIVFARPQIGEFHWWLRCIAGFFLGCLTCLAYRARATRGISSAWSTASLLALLVFLNLRLRGTAIELIFPLSALVIACLVLAPKSHANTLLSWRPFRWLGEVSYSLYMCHALVQWGVRQACRSILKAPSVVVDGAVTAQVSPSVAILLSLLDIAGALTLAWLTFRLIESPGRALTRKWVASWPAARPIVSVTTA